MDDRAESMVNKHQFLIDALVEGSQPGLTRSGYAFS
jgi:hypothetical protein